MLTAIACGLLVVFSFLCLYPDSAGAAPQSPAKDEQGKGRIAVFPLENYSGKKEAEDLNRLLRESLKNKGFELLDEDLLWGFLKKERIRSTAYISRDLAKRLLDEFHVSAVMLGAVYAFSDRENPEVDLSARLVETSGGRIIWAEFALATGEDFTGILGLGTIRSRDKLADRMMKKLLATMPSELSVNNNDKGYRIAVMPFRNNSAQPFAGMIATYMFIVELFKTEGFIPVEYGEVRKAIVSTRTRSRGEIDYNSLEMISETVDVDGILVGVVETYEENARRAAPPEAAITVRLIDARGKRVVFSEIEELNGNEGIWVLEKGKIWSVNNVANKIISKTIKRMGKLKWQ